MSVLAIPPGLHRGIEPAVYHSRDLGLVSKSALDLVHRSPLHYKSWVDGAEEEATPALKFGAAFHCALLEPERYGDEYAVEPDFGDCRKKENKAARNSWRELHLDSTALALEDAMTIKAMVKAVKSHPFAKKLIRNGDAELTVRWKDADSGLECKSRADYYAASLKCVADVKSTFDASYKAFMRDVVNYRYHVQDALYRSGFAAVGEKVDYFVFIAVEKAPPYAVAIYQLDSRGVDKGHVAARRDIDTMAECMKSGKWPGYYEGIQELNLPPWAA